jgi:hypothetical protein
LANCMENSGLEADGLSQGYGRSKLKRNGRGRGRGRGRGKSSSGTIQDKDESSSSGSASEDGAPEVLERASVSKRKADNQLLCLRRVSFYTSVMTHPADFLLVVFDVCILY